MWVVSLLTTGAPAAEFPPDESGCLFRDAPDQDRDGVPDDVELAEGFGDTDDDGCDDVNDPDDDGDGLPTALEDLNGDGNWLNDSERFNRDGYPSSYLDAFDPFDDDGDGYLDLDWADYLEPLGAAADDCEDAFKNAFPGGTEVWYDTVDEDCSGGSDFDQDGDGFDARIGSHNGPDCDDLDPLAYPGGPEDDGPRDGDCDGYSDPHRALVPAGGCSCDAPGAGAAALVLPGFVVPGLVAGRRRRAR